MAVSLKKKGADKECLRIKAIMQRPITNVFLSDLTPAMIQKYINQRLETPSPRGGTLNPAPVRREFGILRSIFNWAVRMEMLDKPPPPTHTHKGFFFQKSLKLVSGRLPKKTLNGCFLHVIGTEKCP